MDVGILIIICFIIQFGSHYLPWKRLNHGRPIARPVAYVIGVLGLYIPLSAWLLLAGYPSLLVGIIWAAASAGGLGCLAGYGLDAVLSLRELARAKAEEADLLRKQRNQNLSAQGMSDPAVSAFGGYEDERD